MQEEKSNFPRKKNTFSLYFPRYFWVDAIFGVICFSRRYDICLLKNEKKLPIVVLNAISCACVCVWAAFFSGLVIIVSAFVCTSICSVLLFNSFVYRIVQFRFCIFLVSIVCVCVYIYVISCVHQWLMGRNISALTTIIISAYSTNFIEIFAAFM